MGGGRAVCRGGPDGHREDPGPQRPRVVRLLAPRPAGRPREARRPARRGRDRELNDAITIALEFLEENPDADAEELKEAQEALQAVAQPLIGKLYEGGAPGEDEDFDDFDDH